MKKIKNITEFVDRAKGYLEAIAKSFDNLPTLKVKKFDPKNTVLVNVDIVNGFCKKGALASPLVEQIISYAVKLNQRFKKFTKIFFIDSHKRGAVEFDAFPPHCEEDTDEAELVDELKPFVDDKAVVCKKNSVNGFLCPDFADWLMKHPHITNFIIIGDVTDICVFNFANTLKAYFNEWNIKARVIVVTKGVETFQLDVTNHDAELMNLFALYNMRMNGVEIVEDII